MEKKQNKRRIESARGMGIKNDENGIPMFAISDNVKSIRVSNTNFVEYGINKQFVKDLQVDIIGTPGNDDTLLNFINNI